MPVTGAGDLIEYTPGDGVGVEVTADANGDVALRGQGVELTGENAQLTEVSLNQTAGGGVGFLARDPDGFTGDQADYSAGDSAGRTELIMYKPVVLLPAVADWDSGTAGDQAGAVGDECEFVAGGDVGPFSAASSPYGVVFRTIGDPAAPEKVAVAVYR